MENKRIIVFDFDGVVCDSTDECMVTAWNAWQLWNKKDGFRRTVTEFSDEEVKSFRKLRPYVRGAGEYYILCNSQQENISILNQGDFDTFAAQWKEFMNPFKKVFFQCREKLRTEDLEEWIKLHPVYMEVINLLKELNTQERLYVATLKDGQSVKLILNYHGIDIPKEKILDQAQVASKLEALNRIAQVEAASKDEMLFIDDNFTHLVNPHKNGYHVYLSSWGNALGEFGLMAKEMNIESITLTDLNTLIPNQNKQ